MLVLFKSLSVRVRVSVCVHTCARTHLHRESAVTKAEPKPEEDLRSWAEAPQGERLSPWAGAQEASPQFAVIKFIFSKAKIRTRSNMFAGKWNLDSRLFWKT